MAIYCFVSAYGKFSRGGKIGAGILSMQSTVYKHYLTSDFLHVL